MPTDLDRLLEEAERQPFEGWDFSWLEGRMRVEPLPWDFEALASAHARQSPDLLDMGTGGGERLSRLMGRPARTVATEAWAPNVTVAARRLRLLGIAVIQVDDALDSTDQPPNELLGSLPFRDSSFHLVMNRHESFVASEVARILAHGGHFLTQQVGSVWTDDFYRLLDLPLPPRPAQRWDLALAVAQVEAAGLELLGQGNAEEHRAFTDVGAVAWYLKAIPWTIPGFTIDGFRPRLAHLHAQILSSGPAIVRVPHFWLEARKPPMPRPSS